MRAHAHTHACMHAHTHTHTHTHAHTHTLTNFLEHKKFKKTDAHQPQAGALGLIM